MSDFEKSKKELASIIKDAFEYCYENYKVPDSEIILAEYLLTHGVELKSEHQKESEHQKK